MVRPEDFSEIFFNYLNQIMYKLGIQHLHLFLVQKSFNWINLFDILMIQARNVVLRKCGLFYLSLRIKLWKFRTVIASCRAKSEE